MKYLLFALLFFFLALKGQTQYQPNAAEIRHQLEKLNVVGSVLYIAAHPDDENTRLIAYLTNEKKYRTGYLSLTRGDGGQNLIGNEQAEQLGVIRTQELLAARKIDGGEQYFTRAYDFGYSKTPEETFKIWNRDSLLADVVWVIRNFKPDVIICRFPTTGEGGHGHHTASAMLAEEAFDASADSKRFTEQLKHVEPWQAKRLLWNTFKFGERNTTSEDQLKIDVGGYNILLGKSYGEIAAHSRTQHSSQAFGTAMNRSSQLEYFKTIKGEVPKKDLLDGLDNTWLRFRNGHYYKNAIEQIITNYNFENPSSSLNALTNFFFLLKEAETIEEKWKQVKLKEVEQLILACSGIWLESISKNAFAAIGDSVDISILAINRSNENVELKKVKVDNFIFLLDTLLNKTILFSLNKKIVFANKEISQPYWLKKNHNKGLFNIESQKLIGKAENDTAVTLYYTLSFNGKEIDFPVKLQTKIVDPAKGEIYQPFIFSPVATATFENEVYVFNNQTSKNISVKIKAFKSNISGVLKLQLPDGFKSIPEIADFSFKEAGNEQAIIFNIVMPSNYKTDKLFNIKATINVNGNESSNSYENIQYSHIPQQSLFFESTGKGLALKINKKKKIIGYLDGAGDKMPQLLAQLGYNVKLISDEEMAANQLQQHESIVIGVRAYNTLPRIKNWQENLMKYVELGGTLVVQYNTNQKLITEKLGPYPFKISRERVTEEDAIVKILNDENVIMNFPNKISEIDFDEWVQERGLYFPSEVDVKYDKLFSMNDTGEKPLENSTISCTYGKGKFIYTSLSFFRQLPAGVSGAYKLFTNFIEQ